MSESSAELKRLQEIEKIMKRMFRKADAEGLYIGIGRSGVLSKKEQEGRNVKRLRKLVKP